MPYRRLPNTDSSRLRAMETALNVSLKVAPSALAYSQKTHQSLKYFLPTYQQALQFYKDAYKNQVDKSAHYAELQRKARLYISHFIQVLNLAILREEIPDKVRSLYGLADYAKKVPNIVTDHEILEWGEKIIEGENKRMMQGGTPMGNPRIALVKINFDNFKEAQRNQAFIKNNYSRTLEKVCSLRPEADRIILNIWNEVEQTYENCSANEKRDRAAEYGLIYVYRKTEKSVEV